MGAHKRLTDEHLASGSVIYWSRRGDPYVPVRCGSCGRERMILLNNATREEFNGICRVCTHGESWEDEILPNGSIVFWSRRDGQHIPIQCGICNDEHITSASNVRKKTFTGLCRTCLHTGPTSTTWRGGRVTKHGYIYVKVYSGHPFYESMANSLGYIAEHRLVMAEHLGRPLSSTEVVHHKNGIRTDNRIENLELFVSFHEHGTALQDRHPHPGYESADKLAQTLNRLKSFLNQEEEETD